MEPHTGSIEFAPAAKIGAGILALKHSGEEAGATKGGHGVSLATEKSAITKGMESSASEKNFMTRTTPATVREAADYDAGRRA